MKCTIHGVYYPIKDEYAESLKEFNFKRNDRNINPDNCHWTYANDTVEINTPDDIFKMADILKVDLVIHNRFNHITEKYNKKEYPHIEVVDEDN